MTTFPIIDFNFDFNCLTWREYTGLNAELCADCLHLETKVSTYLMLPLEYLPFEKLWLKRPEYLDFAVFGDDLLLIILRLALRQNCLEHIPNLSV